MNVAIIYNLVDDWNRVEIASVVDSVTDVQRTLESLGHRVTLVRVDGGVRRFVEDLETLRPDVVLNLCEGYREWSAGESCIAGVLELLGIPYTGAGSTALAVALNKPLSKELFVARNIPTPRFAVYQQLPPEPPPLTFPLFLKLAGEDASVGITAANVVADDAAFRVRLRQMLDEFKAPVLAEEFIDGREFTVAVFDGRAILVEEIELNVEPRIVCFRAKWDTESTQFQNTVPVFTPAITDAQREEMKQIAEQVYAAVGIRDYGRVDFRMNGEGQLYVLEANPNPDISVGAGYRRSLEAAGISFEAFVQRLIDNAARRGLLVGTAPQGQA